MTISVSNLLTRIKRKMKPRRRLRGSKKAQMVRLSAIRSVVRKIVCVIVAVLVVWTIYGFISRQMVMIDALVFSSEGQEGMDVAEKQVKFNENEVFTVLFLIEFEKADKSVIDALTVVRLDSSAKKATVVSFHPDIYFEPCHNGVGSENVVRFKDLLVLGQLQNPSVPLSFAIHQIEYLLAVPVDGYIFIDNGIIEDIANIGVGYSPVEMLSERAGYDEWAEALSMYWVDYLNSVSIWNVWTHKSNIAKVKSNLLVPSFYKFIKMFKKVSYDDVSFVSVGNDSLEEVVNSRGEVVSLVSQTVLDAELSQYTSDVRIDREQARIEIFNGSNIDGLAAKYGRLVRHIGGDLIRVQNAPGEWENSIVYVTDPMEFEYTLKKVKSLWDDDIDVVEGRPDFVTTGDIIIVLGMDF